MVGPRRALPLSTVRKAEGRSAIRAPSQSSEGGRLQTKEQSGAGPWGFRKECVSSCFQVADGESGSRPLGGLGWVGSVGSLGDCLGFVLNELSVLVSASGSSSTDLGILSGTVVVVWLPTSRERFEEEATVFLSRLSVKD